MLTHDLPHDRLCIVSVMCRLKEIEVGNDSTRRTETQVVLESKEVIPQAERVSQIAGVETMASGCVI